MNLLLYRDILEPLVYRQYAMFTFNLDQMRIQHSAVPPKIYIVGKPEKCRRGHKLGYTYDGKVYCARCYEMYGIIHKYGGSFKMWNSLIRLD